MGVIRSIPLDKALDERVEWFVRLRWWAGGAICLLGFAAAVFIPALRTPALVGLGLSILLYNVLIRLAIPRLGARRGLHLQIVLDWLALAVLCHVTMGLESPFLPFFLFHVILASMLTSRRACLMHGLLAIVVISSMALLEFSGVLPLTPMPGIPALPRYENGYYLLLFLGSFSALILLTIYISTSVIQHLRQGEEKQLELQENLGRAYEELRELDQVKTRFMRVVSHEIRSPLAAARSILQVILEGYAGEVPDKIRDFVRRCDVRLVQLSRLTNELLDLIRGGRPLAEEEKQDVPVQETISKALSDLAVYAEEKGVRLDVGLEAWELIFRGDRQDLERIVVNLVSNAITYTREGGLVKVRGELEDGQSLRLEVVDTGIGIPEADLPRIFDEFFRAANAKREKNEGTGLGLAIVRRTVEKYGGRIDVASEPGKGSVFTARLPVLVQPR